MNSLRTIDATLDSVRGLAATIVVIDSGSTDGTIERCTAAGAVVEHHPWSGYVAQTQHAIDRAASSLAAADGGALQRGWILLLDSDEALDEPLQRSVRAALATPTGHAGFALNRRLVLAGRVLRHAFQPEFRLRLFRPHVGRVTGTPPHYFISVQGSVGRLEGSLLHDSWADVDDMLRRQVRYASISADDRARGATTATADSSSAGIRGGRLIDVLIRPGFAFVKQFVVRSAWRDGWRGLVASGGAAAATLMKHVAIAERRGLLRERDVERRPPQDS